eukprot:TRINITY_DN9492_c0_g7_i2.p3 TRINITY_DN9492_c0_g7~~TRINITY_DN9492_c0_g7_i2.p3  ORF type:complete len:197 (-),score=71.04 TRINITY_DN9492_c0_g7_i2:944-1534(-)
MKEVSERSKGSRRGRESLVRETGRARVESPLGALYLNKENEPAESPEKELSLSPRNLPEVIVNMSEALEISNSTVQKLKTQLETVLQRESTLQMEYEMMAKRYEDLLQAKSESESHLRLRNEKELQKRGEVKERLEELQELLKQKNKVVEMKNLEIAEFTKKLNGIIQEHNNEVMALNDEIKEIKSKIKHGEEKQR